MTDKEALLQLCEFAYSQAKRKQNPNWWGSSTVWNIIIDKINEFPTLNKLKIYLNYKVIDNERYVQFFMKLPYYKTIEYIKQIEYQNNMLNPLISHK